MTQTELLTNARLAMSGTVRRGAAKSDRVLLRSAAGLRRISLTPAQAAILSDCFSTAATVPEGLARLLGEHRCPPLDEYYELVLQAHAAGVLLAEGEEDAPTLALRWPLRLPHRASGSAGAALLLAGVVALLIPRWSAPSGWGDWVLGWLAACALVSAGETLAACALSGSGCEVRGARLAWLTLLPHFRVDSGEAAMDGRPREMAVAALRAAPSAVGAAVIAWRQPGLLAPALAGLLYVLAPWGPSAARQWLGARSGLPRPTVRTGFLFEHRRSDAWEQVRAWKEGLGLGPALLWIAWTGLAAGAAVRFFPGPAEKVLGSFGSAGRLHPILGASAYVLAGCLVAAAALLARALFMHWVLRRRLARPLRSDSSRKALAAALKGEPAEILRQVALFQGLSDDDMTALAVTVRLLEVAGGKDVFQEDDPADAFFVILEGELEVIKRRAKPSGRADTIGRLGPGDAFGEIALLDGTTRTATVRTTRPCQLLRLMKDDFDRLVVRNVGAARVRELLQNTAFLGRLVFLAGWSFADLLRYAQKCGTVRFDAGFKVLTKGATNNWFYLIFDGAFEARDGKKVLRRMQPGDYFGEISLLEHGEATADVYAVEESRCLTMTRTDFQQFFSRDFRIGLRMEELAARRLGSSLFSSR